LTSALVEGEWLASRPGRFTPGERAPGDLWIGGWVGPRTGQDHAERRKIFPVPGLELRPLGCPARSRSLYRLSSVSIVTRLSQDDRRIGVLFPGGKEIYVFSTGLTQPLIQWVPGSLSPEVKWPELEAGYSSPSGTGARWA
jgi:hypothetical protein